jgi:hypothetical protein
MNDAAREALARIVARHGAALASDARRSEALLKDYCGQYPREIFLLVSAVEEGVTRELAASDGVPARMLVGRLATRLVDSRAISESAARWAVASWAVALGVVGPDDASWDPRPTAASDTARATATAGPHPEAVPESVVSADGRADFTTIGAALAAAAPGSRIRVRPGTYDEAIVIDRAVEIAGDGPVEQILVRSAGGSCVRMEADEAAVRGLTLRCVAGRGNAAFFAVDVPRGRLVLEDCDVSSNSLSCVGIHGATARPLVRRCALHGGADAGVYVFDGGGGAIEACDIFENANVGIAITSGGAPTVRDSRIFRGRNAGIVSWGGGSGTIERCEIFGNAQAGIGISEGGNPIVTLCRIYDGGNSGVFVHDGGHGSIVGCDISGHGEAEVAITGGAAPTLRGCTIHGGVVGVMIAGAEGGTIEACEIARNADAGIALGAGSRPTVYRCRIHANGGPAVRAEAGAAGTFVGCDLGENAGGAWLVDPNSDIRASGTRE